MASIVQDNCLFASWQEPHTEITPTTPTHERRMSPNNTNRSVSLEHIPPLPFTMPPDFTMDDIGKQCIPSPPPMVRRRSCGQDGFKHPGTPTSTATTSSTRLSLSADRLTPDRKIMEVTITVLSLDGLIAKRDEPKERPALLKELSSLSSHGLSISKHGLSRLSSHGKRDIDAAKERLGTLKERLSRHSNHGSNEDAVRNRPDRSEEGSPLDALSRYSSHGTKEKVKLMKDGSMSLSSHDKRKTDEDLSSNDNETNARPELATVVASFSHSVTQKNVLFTHLPSQPMELASSTTVQPIAYWSSIVDLDDADQALSTLKFKRPFVKDRRKPSSGASDDSNASKFISQKCPISLSVSRNGKMIEIGTASVIISGDEDGERTLASRVKPKIKVSKSKLPSVMSSDKGSFPMFKAKGDNISFGLRPDAKLRLLVHVTEPHAMVASASKLEPAQHDFPIKEIGHMEMKPEQDAFPNKNLAGPHETENKTDSNCTDEASECDEASTDEEVWEEYIVEDNEIRHLREQLAKSESANKILQLEIAQSRDALQTENEKYEGFCSELEEVKKNADTTIESLREELQVAKCEAMMLPVYESRINKLLEELKVKDNELKKRGDELLEKDGEIACLREEIEEIRDGFKSQVNALSQANINTLLWDIEGETSQEETTQNNTTPSKTDKWLAEGLSVEWSGLKNALRNRIKHPVKDECSTKDESCAVTDGAKEEDTTSSKDESFTSSKKSVHWEEEEEVNIIEEDPLLLVVDEEEEAMLVSDDEANDMSYDEA